MASSSSIMDCDFGTDIDLSRFKEGQLDEMKKRFPDIDHRTLARFLGARNGKDGQVNLSTDLLKRHQAWEAGIYPILKSTCLAEFAKGKFYIKGKDKEGHPLLVFQSFLHDPKDYDSEQLGRAILFCFATALKELPDNKTKVTLLMDRTDMNFSPDMDLLKQVAALLSNHYPERLHRTIIYPSGFVFYGIWTVAQMFLDPVTRDKVKPVVYLSGVEEFIDKKDIPNHMGGDSDYVFNETDYSDPYPEDVTKAAAFELEQGITGPSIYHEPLAEGEGLSSMNLAST